MSDRTKVLYVRVTENTFNRFRRAFRNSEAKNYEEFIVGLLDIYSILAGKERTLNIYELAERVKELGL